MATFIVNALDAVLFTDNTDPATVIREEVVFSDTATITTRQTVYLNDRFNLTTTPKTVYSVNVYDTVDFIEGPKNIISVLASDTMRFLDASYRVVNYTVTISDDVLFDDSPSGRFDFTDTLVDNVAFTDSHTPVITLTVSDNLVIQDSATWFKKYVSSSEAVFTDSPTAFITYAVETEDTVEFSEAKQFSIWGTASDTVEFSDSTDEVRLRSDALDTVEFTDKAELFGRYIEQCADEVVFNDYVDSELKPFILWLSEGTLFEDDASNTVYFRVRQRETIGFSDESSARMIVRIEESDNLNFTDGADSAVYWATPQIGDDSTAVFTDSCSVKVSSYRTTEFTNALVAGVSTSDVTVYTSPSNSTSTILNISLCNVAALDITVDTMLYKDGSATPIYIRKDLPIAVGETYVINNIQEEGIQIDAGDTIQIKGSEVDSVDVFLSVIEQT